MKSVDDRVVAAVIHGLIAAAVEKEVHIAERAIELAKDYLAGKAVDGYKLDDRFVESTISMVKDTFNEEETVG